MENDKTNLDVLRSFAVTTVMVDHLVPTIHTHGLYVNPVVLQFTAHIGQIGVLAFFVHTSLVLMYSLERLAQRPTGGSIATRFYIRRLFRIYPLSIACVAVVLLLGIPPLPWRETPPYGANVIIANLLLVQNLYTGQSVLSPLWSLPYEVEMYVLLPLLFFVARKKSGVGSLHLLIAAACAGGIALAFITHGRLNMAAYAPCFLAGVLCYALQSRQKAVLPATLWPLWIVVLIVSYCLLHTRSPRPVYWMGWILCLILGWTINLFRDGRNRAVNVLGQDSAVLLWLVPHTRTGAVSRFRCLADAQRAGRVCHILWPDAAVLRDDIPYAGEAHDRCRPPSLRTADIACAAGGSRRLMAYWRSRAPRSLVGSGAAAGGGGASRLSLFNTLIIISIASAMMVKSNTVWRNSP